MAQTVTQRQLRELRELMRSILEEADAPSSSLQSHWELPVLPPPDAGGQLSSTDLLSWWFRAPKTGGNPWDAFLSGGDDAEVPARPVGAPREAGGAGEPSLTQPEAEPWDAILSSGFDAEAHLADEHAQGAVDCLYDFLHAFGRLDVEDAMRHVADDYHALEDDDEVDRLKFRHRIESVVDASRGWELSVSLCEAPEPLSHPHGVLIACDIQIDAYHPQTRDTTSRVEKRVAVLRQDAEGDWKISALALVDG